MDLLRLIGIKSSAKKMPLDARGVGIVVANAIMEADGQIMDTSAHVVGIPPVYSHGGCGCGCAPEFQFFYDGNRLAVLPCSLLLDGSNWELDEENKRKLLFDIQSRLGVKEVYLVRRGEEPPEFLREYLR